MKKQAGKNIKSKKSEEVGQSVKVMYQNVGGQWFAFAQVGEEIFCGQVPLQQKPEEYGKELKARLAKEEAA